MAPDIDLLNKAQALMDVNTQLSQPLDQNHLLKSEFNKLTEEIMQAISTDKYDSAKTETSDLHEQLALLETMLEELNFIKEASPQDVEAFETGLNSLTAQITNLDQIISALEIPETLTRLQIDQWQNKQTALAAQVPTGPGVNGKIILAVIFAALAIIGGIFKLLKSKGPKMNSQQLQALNELQNLENLKLELIEKHELGGLKAQYPDLFNEDASELQTLAAQAELARNLNPEMPSLPKELINENGYVIAGSTPVVVTPGMMQAPLIVDGSNVSTVVTPISEEKIFRAVGRIGLPYVVDPDRDNIHSRGTGTLITRKHVLTNAHVAKRLDAGDDLSGFGIDFLALQDDDRSDFYPFSDIPPIYLENLDMAVLTLAEPYPTQDPAPLKYIERDSLKDRDIRTIGYPHPQPYPDNLVYEEDEDFNAFGGWEAVFSVKRVCDGKIFGPYHYFEHDDYEKKMPVVTFNATVASGNSGSPVFDKETNELLGVYFYGSGDFDGKIANLAIPIDAILTAFLKAGLNDAIELILTEHEQA